MRYLLLGFVFCLCACSPEEKPLQAPPQIDSAEPSMPPDFAGMDFDTSGGISEMPEVMPEFPGGEVGLMRYLSTEIKYPPMEKESGTTGTVFVRFLVEKNGQVSSISIERGVAGHDRFSNEVFRVISKMPKWKPGMIKGKPTRTSLVLPVKFALD